MPSGIYKRIKKWKLSDETKKKMSLSHKGKKLSEEHKRNIGLSEKGEKNHFFGKKHTEETKKKMSEDRKGRVSWNKGTIGIMKSWNKGIPCPEDTKEMIRKTSSGKHYSPNTEFKKGQTGSICVNWKGDKVGYFGVHHWVEKQKGKPKICEHCGAIRKDKRFHWANKKHDYKRNLDDYISLCASCHKKYDLKYNS